MAEPLVLPRFPALDSAPSREDVDEGIATFRAEFERCEDRSAKAALAHHMAVLLERRGDLPAAARDELTATNLAPGFTAPLEALIRIARESRSASNLDRLLLRLITIDQEPAAKERARLQRAFLLLDQGQVGDALGEAEEAFDESPQSAAAALCLDLISARAGEHTDRLRATERRITTSGEGELRELLLQRLARQREAAGDTDSAQRALQEVAASSTRLETLGQLERLARRTGDGSVVAEAALRAAELQEDSTGDARTGQGARLRGALAHLSEGNLQEARAQLEILAHGEHSGLFEAALLFAFGQSDGDTELARSALRRMLSLTEPSPDGSLGEDRGLVHLLASLLAARDGDDERTEQHRAEAERLLPGGLAADACELLRIVSAGESPEDRLAESIAFLDGLIDTVRSSQTSTPAAGAESPASASSELAEERHGGLSSLLLVKAATQLTAGDPSRALATISEATAAGLAESDSARLALGILRATGTPEDLLRLLSSPPEGLPPETQISWLLQALRTRLSLPPAENEASSEIPTAHQLLEAARSRLLAYAPQTPPQPPEDLLDSSPREGSEPRSAPRDHWREELIWLQRALEAPGNPAAAYLPQIIPDERELSLASPELERALALATLLLRPTSSPDHDAPSAEDASVSEALAIGLLRDHPDFVTLGLGLGLPGVAFSEKELTLLRRIERDLEESPTRDAVRLRAGLLALSRALEFPGDLERRQTASLLAAELLLPLFNEPSQNALGELGPWLRRAAGSAGADIASDSSEPLDQLEAALTVLDHGDIEGSSGLSLSRLTPPLCGAAQLLRLLLAMGLSAEETQDALSRDAFIDDELKAQLVLASAFLTGSPETQLRAALGLPNEEQGLAEALTVMTCARLALDQDAEADALRSLATLLDSVELKSRQMASEHEFSAPSPDDARQAERQRTDSLLELAAQQLALGRAVTGATVTWELLERLGRRFEREGFTDDLWRDRRRALESLAECQDTPATEERGAPEDEAKQAAGAAGQQEAAFFRLQAGYLALGVGDDEDALAIFSELLNQLPDDEALFLGLRVAAARTKNAALEAQASIELARRSQDHRHAAELWERAGLLLQDELDQSDRAAEAFAAALSRLPKSQLSFQRLYELAVGAGDRDRLIELIDTRLPTIEDDHQRAELLWEKARYCRGLGRPTAALSALDELLRLEPEHLQALALCAELHLVDRRLEPAATTLRSIALHPQTPADQRAEAGLHAADLLEGLHRPKEALALLGDLARLGVPEEELLERRARTAALAGQWDTAYEGYRQMAQERDVISERLRAARLTLAIVRDHLASPDELKEAARLVLRDSPTDEDAIAVVVHENFNPDERSRLLAPALEECLADLRQNPLDAARMDRLCLLTEQGKSAALERLALGMLSLTGSLGGERAKRLADLSERARRVPTAPLSHADLQSVASPGQLGTFAELGRMSASFLRQAALPNQSALGITDSMRVDPFSGSRTYEECESLCSALSLGDYELFVGGAFSEAVMVLPGDLPTILLGGDLPIPLGDVPRARLCYLVFSHLVGTSLLLQMSLREAESWLDAIFRLNTTDVDSGERDDAVEERAQALAQLLDRDEAESLAELASQLKHGGMTPSQLVVWARAGAARMATLIHGDPSIIRRLPELIPADETARNQVLAEVVRFASSDAFLRLRNKLGLELP